MKIDTVYVIRQDTKHGVTIRVRMEYPLANAFYVYLTSICAAGERVRMFSWDADVDNMVATRSKADAIFGRPVLLFKPLLDNRGIADPTARLSKMRDVSSLAAWGYEYREPSGMRVQLAAPHVAGVASGYVIMATRLGSRNWDRPFLVVAPERYGPVTSKEAFFDWIVRFRTDSRVDQPHQLQLRQEAKYAQAQ